MIDTYDAYPFFIGIAAYVGGVIYGIIRAQTYHKPGSQVTKLPIDSLGIDLVSSKDNNIGLKVSYTWRY